MGVGQWRSACKRSCDAGCRSRMQRDAAVLQPVYFIGRQRGGPAWSPGRCAAPSLSPHVFVVFCATRAGLASCVCVCVPAGQSSKWKLPLLEPTDAMVRVCACAGEWLELPMRSHGNVDWFLVAAGDFDMLLRFARAVPWRAAHIGMIGVVWCVW